MRPSAPADAADVDWTVYGPNGTAVATVAAPARFGVVAVDDTHALVAYRDEFDVEFVASPRVGR